MDRDIDDVARSLTAGPPPAVLRSAVLAGVTRRSTRSHVGRWYAAGAMAAAVVILILAWPDRERTASAPATSEAVVTARPLSVVSPSVEGSQTGAGRGPSSSRRESSGIRDADAQLATRDESPLQVEDLEVNPLEVQALDIPTMVVEGLEVQPLLVQ